MMHMKENMPSCCAENVRKTMQKYILAIDTAHEYITVGLAKADFFASDIQAYKKGTLFSSHEGAHIEQALVAEVSQPAQRQSNALLVSTIDNLCKQAHVLFQDIVAVISGRGPGSFTGVRICLATAKGIAFAGGIPLFGVSTLETIAWTAWQQGTRGLVCVVSDAMRKEVYPALYLSNDKGIVRLTNDTVVKAETFSTWLATTLEKTERVLSANIHETCITFAGDALKKYPNLAEDAMTSLNFCSYDIATQDVWRPTAFGLCASVKTGGDAASLLPIYTRLSDAEEHERTRVHAKDPKNLLTGVQSTASGAISYISMHSEHVPEVAALESVCMGADAWNLPQFEQDILAPYRTWWVAQDQGRIVGYVGMLLAGDCAELLKIAVDPAYQRRHIARTLLEKVSSDMRDLGATHISLEVRASNDAAQHFYRACGLEHKATRKAYYSDGGDAYIYEGPLCITRGDVAGMDAHINEVASVQHVQNNLEDALQNIAHPIILAFESSCDETAVALIDGNGIVVSDVVASQIDFHARFGGVVPEIASRKHIEAIYGVAQVACEHMISNITGDQSCSLTPAQTQ
ncbi:MAG: tRNA (adenosine(37)-N6)-threonylcarbamoyltransferase complex dimerization subunit type 1 TsaB, partial [Eggerthellaceae bacterium]|nr:tRNA (adenosine(37)-N6)-threonylcarbamoyltransferase complex dimerization subunit type 1 TsaB [Eggerthellaceae bacterium]